MIRGPHTFYNPYSTTRVVLSLQKYTECLIGFLGDTTTVYCWPHLRKVCFIHCVLYDACLNWSSPSSPSRRDSFTTTSTVDFLLIFNRATSRKIHLLCRTRFRDTVLSHRPTSRLFLGTPTSFRSSSWYLAPLRPVPTSRKRCPSSWHSESPRYVLVVPTTLLLYT